MRGPKENGIPSRTGMRRIIVPWAFRHLRAVAVIRITVGVILTILGVITLTLGSFTPKAIAFAIVFFAAAVAHFSLATWLLSIARSTDPVGDGGK